MSTEQIIINLETLMAAVELQPEAQFNLNFFRQEEPCGTLFCTVGLAATMPFFIEKGFGFGKRAYNGSNFFVTLNGEHIMESPEELAEVFGEKAFSELFSPSGMPSDAALGYEEELDANYEVVERNMSDKELALLRLRTRIAAYKEMV